MSRPTFEVADIVRRTGNSFWQQHQPHFAWPHGKVLDAIVRCRTAALGGHLDQCVRCGHKVISLNSCHNRHCPSARGTRARWLAARSADLLPISYFHVVFTLPHELSARIAEQAAALQSALPPSAATMLELARDPKHLGADIGFLGVLQIPLPFLRLPSRAWHRNGHGELFSSPGLKFFGERFGATNRRTQILRISRHFVQPEIGVTVLSDAADLSLSQRQDGSSKTPIATA
jgi:hypothetical protein